MISVHFAQLFPSPIHPISSTKTSQPQNNNNKNIQKKREIEIRVCNNRTCRRQGSFQTLETLMGLSPPHVAVISCGCLGRCGNGPNLVVLPEPVMLSHCGSAAQAARVMVHFCGEGGDDDDSVVRGSLDALAFRKRAEVEMEKGNFSEADNLFSQAIEAKPIGGIHFAYKGRSAVRLASGNFVGALEDAKEALLLHPQYAEAYICQGDAFLATNQLQAAEESYNMGLKYDPSLFRSKSFKTRVEKLRERMTSTSMS